jgi:hypothetical protein
MAIDGTCFDVPDSKENADYFGYPSSSRGDTAFPQLWVVGPVETGTHIILLPPKSGLINAVNRR